VPWDKWAGLGKEHLSPKARRLAVLAGSSWSFDEAARNLAEFCGLRISDYLIRQASDRAGQQAQRWQTQAAAGGAFRAEGGAAEFYTDGTSVNTRRGWREIRVGVFAKRQPGPPAQPDEWARRKLPAPTVRLAFARLEDSERFGARWAGMAQRLGLKDQPVTALADGAKWIWKQVARHLPRGECVVDIYHVSEHLHACGRSLCGDGTSAARAWAEQRLGELLEAGPVRFLESLAAERRQQRGAVRRRAVQALENYLRPNVDGLWYRARLERGLPIGSGLVEGACKTILGRRLKINSARWRPERAEHVAALRCLLYNEQWATFWDTDAA